MAGGYFLGRTKKMKLALMLGGMAAGRRAGGPGELLGQGAKLLSSSPELAALREQVTTRLVEVGKDAVKAAAARQIGALTDRVSGRVESLADPERITAVRPRKRRGKTEADEVDDVDEVDEEKAEDSPAPNDRANADSADDAEATRPPVKRAARTRSTSANSSRSRTSAKKESSQGRVANSPKTSSSGAAPKRRTGAAAASRATGAARTATKSTRTARGSGSAR